MIKRILALMAGAFSFCMLLNAQTITIVDKTTLRPLDGVSLSSEQ